MATVNLNPNAGVYNSWTVVGGGDYWTELADTDDTNGIRHAGQNRICIVDLDDYSSGGTIDSVRFYIRGVLWNTRSGDTDVQVRIGKQDHTNTNTSTYYDETVTLTFNAGYAMADYYGTARTTYDGSNPWHDTTGDGSLDRIRLDINTIPEDPPGGSRAWITKAYLEVTYTTIVEAPDNATFFGTNF